MECFYSNNNGNLLVKKNIFTDINILKLTCTNTIKILATNKQIRKEMNLLVQQIEMREK